MFFDRVYFFTDLIGHLAAGWEDGLGGLEVKKGALEFIPLFKENSEIVVRFSWHVDFSVLHCQIVIYLDVIRIILLEFFIKLECGIIISGGLAGPSKVQGGLGIFLVY